MPAPADNPACREEDIFAAALALPAGQRNLHLDEHCAGDAGLRRRVEALLVASTDAGDLLDAPPTGFPGHASLPGPTSPVITEKAGDQIGHYRLLEEIGSGGCGMVYLAEQEKPVRRQVALKVIKLGMDTRQVVARFNFERQTLASMEHPNIARVFDGGETASGRPYFVMELVRGERITDYCDQQWLSTRERLGMFLQVCQAIQHAHQKGVIHRDLKPSNILVAELNGAPVPKVIDFGIAKVINQQQLAQETIFTGVGQFVGTPAYMSPEQAELSGRSIDTRSDIYSLGVLLYELLTGSTPLDTRQLLELGVDELCRRVREQETPRPSTHLTTMDRSGLTELAGHRRTEPAALIHALRGDLDWIVLKAMEKDPARRYESVETFAADISRHLRHEPVLARPPSPTYLLRKLIRRHKLAFAAGAAVSVSLILGLAVSTRLYFEEQSARLVSEHALVQAERSEREAQLERDAALKAQAEAQVNKARADQEAASVKAVSDLMRYDILMHSETNPLVAVAGVTVTNRLLRSLMEQDGSRLENRFAGQPLTEATIRLALGRTLLDLQDGRTGIEHLERAYALRNEILGADDPGTIEAMMQLADACRRLRRFDRALELLVVLVKVQQSWLGADAPGTHETLLHLAAVQGEMGAHAASLETLERVLASQRAQPADDARIAQTLFRLGRAQQGQGDATTALASFENALELALVSCGTNHSLTIDLQKATGRAWCAQGTWDKGLPLLEQALAAEGENRGPDTPEVRTFQSEVAFASESAGRQERALELYQDIHDHLQARHGNNHWAVGKARVDLMRARHGPTHAETLGAMFDLGRSYAGLHQHDAAVSSYEQALDLMRATREPDDPDMLTEMFNLAGLRLGAGSIEQALALYGEIISRGTNSGRTDRIFLAKVLLQTETIHRKLDQPEAAGKAHERAVQLVWNRVGNPASLTYQVANALDPDLVRLGLHEETRTLYVQAFENSRAELGAAHPDTFWALHALGDAHERAGWSVPLEKFLLKTLAELEAEGSAPYLCVTCMELLERNCLRQGKAEQAAQWRSKHLALKKKLNDLKAGRN